MGRSFVAGPCFSAVGMGYTAPMPPRANTRSIGRKTWTAEEVQQAYARQGKEVPAQVRQVLDSLGLGKHVRADEVPAGPQSGKRARKRRGVEVAPIVGSLRTALIEGAATPLTLSLWFQEARLLSVNELFSIQQFRLFEVFGYKKASRKLIARAIEQLKHSSPQPLPFFEGPTRLSLYRRGKKPVDLDSLPAMFKYLTDSLRREGVISDDNPEVIVQLEVLQENGPPCLGMRLERLVDWTPPLLEGLRERWLGQALELPPAPVKRRKRARA